MLILRLGHISRPVFAHILSFSLSLTPPGTLPAGAPGLVFARRFLLEGIVGLAALDGAARKGLAYGLHDDAPRAGRDLILRRHAEAEVPVLGQYGLDGDVVGCIQFIIKGDSIVGQIKNPLLRGRKDTDTNITYMKQNLKY